VTWVTGAVYPQAQLLNFGLVPSRQNIVEYKIRSVRFEAVERFKALLNGRRTAILSAERRHHADHRGQRYKQYHWEFLPRDAG